MKTEECNKIVSSYLAWLRKGLSVRELEDGACSIATPFLDRKNDRLQVIAERQGGKVVLHDDGDVLTDLGFLGVDFKAPSQQERLLVILNGIGVGLEEGRLAVKAAERKTGQALHSLIQAMLAVNDLFVLAAPQHQRSVFSEEVSKFFSSHEVRFSHRVKLTGKSGFDHAVDYLVPSSRKAPERIVKAINSPNRNTIGNYLFVLGDTRKARNGAQSIAVLNDTGRKVKDEIIEALEAYQVQPALWSDRKRFIKRLVS